MYKTIRFHGVLRERFGKEWRLEVNSVKEAMRLLSVQIQGLEHFILNAHKQGLRFAIFTDKRKTISDKEVDMDIGAELIRIVPIVEGAGGSGLLQTVLGAVLIVAGFWTGGTTSNLGVALIGAGAGMAMGGIASMLMPAATTTDQNQDGNKANKGFGGAVTTVAQGNPVPILYGQREIGGFIISAGQYPEDQL
ncbi:tail assembly protein [Acinetobacter gerneri]|uniref:tail assembly protein n=1 Tax=Acinetobacter gerneri TaxID=202952 RepID=UPI002935CA61|nr:tail assembly protein [Acinetobacter gerneri]MDV2441531.1 tail assembly protein [Acinetobacter gerneri]